MRQRSGVLVHATTAKRRDCLHLPVEYAAVDGLHESRASSGRQRCCVETLGGHPVVCHGARRGDRASRTVPFRCCTVWTWVCGRSVTDHPDVDAISFTGESATGEAIAAAAATGLREVSLELGGKNAVLVFDDAHMARVIEGVTRSAFFNCGQICCTERAYVHRSRFDEFVERIAAWRGRW